ARRDVERAVLDEPRVHDRVEERVVDDVVDVTVGVVVDPARGDRLQMRVVRAIVRLRSRRGHAGVLPPWLFSAAARIAAVTRNRAVRRYAPGTVDRPPAMNASTSSRCASVSLYP